MKNFEIEITIRDKESANGISAIIGKDILVMSLVGFKIITDMIKTLLTELYGREETKEIISSFGGKELKGDTNQYSDGLSYSPDINLFSVYRDQDGVEIALKK